MKVSGGPAAGLFPNLLAGLTSGLVALVYSLSFASLIFSGKLSAYFPQGVGIALIGAIVTLIIVAWRSSFPFSIAGPEANSAIIIALSAASVAATLDTPERQTSVFPTVWAVIILGTLSTGLFLYLLGRFRLGRLARYIPYPVVGGFLAGTGWLIMRSSFKVMTGIPLDLEGLRLLARPETAAEMIAGLAMAAVLFVVLKRVKHFLALPILLLAGIVVGNAGWILQKHSSLRWSPDGWFFKPFSHESIWQAWEASTLHHVDWTVVLHQGGALFAMLVIVMLSILLNSTGLELATSRNVDIDQELRANGIANLLNGFCGGMVGHLSLNRCMLNQQAGARSSAAAVIAGVFCGVVLFFSSSFLAFVPKAVLGGLLFYIGSKLLLRWVYEAWFQFSRIDHFLIVGILAVIATLGFLQGIGAGILISCLLFILSYGRTSCIKHTLSGANFHSNVFRSAKQAQHLQREGDGISILVLHGFVFFGTANDLYEGIRRRLEGAGERRIRFVVFDFRMVTGLDSSAILSFKKLQQLADRSALSLIFSSVGESIIQQMRQGDLFTGTQSEIRCFSDLDRAVEWCEDQMLASSGLLRIPAVSLETHLEELLGSRQLALKMMAYVLAMEVPEGHYLFREGERSDGLYFIESGRVSVVIGLSDGRTLRRRTYTGGAILGEMGFYSGDVRSASVIADETARVHFLSTASLRKIESDAPELASRFNHGVVNLLAERLRHSEEEVRNLLK